MAVVKGKYVNPFYQEVDGFVKNELSTRAAQYGAPIRSGLGDPNKEAATLEWSYKKTAYGVVIGEKGTVLGGQTTPLMSNAKGNLTLYEQGRNLPRYPLLQSITVTNEGTLGSLIKGTFVFTMWPRINASGFQIDNIEDEFFKPGRECKLRWGWSVRTNDANNGQFVGIIYNFSWTVNQDLSITATISVVSKGTVAIGVSGEQTNPEKSDPPIKDPLDNPIPDGDLAGIIQADITEISKTNTSANKADVKIFKAPQVKSKHNLEYVMIGIPKSPAEDPGNSGVSTTTNQQPANTVTPPNPITEPVYFMRLGKLVELMNSLLSKAPNAILDKLFTIQCDGNITEYLPDIVSTAPERIFFPDEKMGNYGPEFSPVFNDELKLRAGVTIGPTGKDNCVNIGRILIATTVVIDVYKSFVKDNQAGIEYKNITKFFEELIKEVNYASGETYQLSVSLIDSPKGTSDKAILSIEDTNLTKAVTDVVTPYSFTATIAKPIMKSVSISSKPPAASAAAAYTEARGGGPQQVDVRHDSKDPQGDAKKALEAITDLKKSLVTKGAGPNFTNEMKGNISNYKRSSPTGHWLNKVLYPIEFSVTIDGIDGFKFGDIIRTNLIPQRYNDPDTAMVFMVTKITHNIKDGVWETTLDTKSRIKA